MVVEEIPLRDFSLGVQGALSLLPASCPLPPPATLDPGLPGEAPAGETLPTHSGWYSDHPLPDDQQLPP